MRKFSFLIAIVLTITTLSCNLSPKIDIKENTPQKKNFGGVEEKNTKLSEIKWWEEFGDKNLNKFVNKVISNSLDFQNSTLTIEKFKLLYKISKSNLWPNVSFSTGASRNKTNLKTFLPQGGSFKNTNYSLMFNASYEIDIFEKLTNEERQGFYTFLNMEETQNSIKLSIISNAVSLFLRYSEISKEIELTEKLLTIKKLEFNSMKSRYLEGIITSDILLSTTTSLKQIENTLAQLKQTKAEIEKMIKNVLSETELNINPTDFAKISRNLPPVKPGLPSELLLRRPDIKAAYYDIKARTAGVGSAKANLFPSIKLTASDGFSTTELSMLLNQKSNVWNFGISIFQPIFNRGALKNQLNISRKELEISINNYKKTVINAFSEVDLLLEQYKLLQNQIKNQRLILKNQKSVEKKKFKDYLSGNESYENYLIEKEKLINQQIALNKLILGYLTNRVSLYKALGGGIEEINKTNIEVK